MKMTFGTRRTLRVTAALVVTGMLAASATATATAAADAAGQPWTGGWEAGMTAGGPSLSDQTVRMVVHTNAAGREGRLRLRNAHRSAPPGVGGGKGAGPTPGGGVAAPPP